jgi:agmatine deiminase
MSEEKVQTPAERGYRWPAEWEPQASVWLAWPRNPNTWPGHFEPVPAEFVQFVRLLAEYEPVNILAGGREVMEQARSFVGELKNVTLHDIPTNDAWCRDHGPTFLNRPPQSRSLRPSETSIAIGPPLRTTSPQETVSPPRATGGLCDLHSDAPVALVDWGYNAWGGKYPPFDLDNEVPRRIAELQGRWRFVPGIILEGGAIDGNGRGCILTTELCLLNPNRNPGISREQIEGYLRDYLAARKILWLTGGEIAGDDTDGHIDQIARFVNPTAAVVSLCDDRADDNFGPTQQNLRELEQMTDQEGRRLELVPLRLPPPLYCDGQRLPAGYCNFLIANGVVIVPQFGDPADKDAIRTLEPLFPGRDVRGCPSLNLIWGLGSFHCLSQQEPVQQERVQ